MSASRRWWLSAGQGNWNVLVRLSMAFVFVLEGYQKLVYPEILGAGRFVKMGIPFPELTGPFVGVVEMVCGALLLVGLFARLAAVPIIIVMLVALFATKLPILLGEDLWMFRLRDLNRYGFLSMTHEARTDVAMLLEALFILFSGAGRWSVDGWRSGSRR